MSDVRPPISGNNTDHTDISSVDRITQNDATVINKNNNSNYAYHVIPMDNHPQAADHLTHHQASSPSSSSSCANVSQNPKPTVRSTAGIKVWKINSRLAACLTCIQFCFAIYATYLLYFMSPTISLVAHSEAVASASAGNGAGSESSSNSLASQFAQRWKELVFNRHSATISALSASAAAECEHEEISFPQKKSNDSKMINIKQELYNELLQFQQKNRGCETLSELLAMPSEWPASPPNTEINANNSAIVRPRIAVILNHYRRKTLCAQIDALLNQTLPFDTLWVMAFGLANRFKFSRVVDSYNDSRISFVSSSYDFKFYGRFQLAMQAPKSDYVYIVDDDMIPGARVLEILAHVAGTQKYGNALLGSIGRILPLRQKDGSFPSYRKFRSREAGLYVPDPAYGIVVDRMLQVDFLSSSWFMATELLKSMHTETPFTFATGEDLHLSYQLQKYRDTGSFVVPVDPADMATSADQDHRLAYIAEATVIHKDVVQLRDEQWWRTLVRGFVTQWAVMEPQRVTALFYAQTLSDVEALAPLIAKFRSTHGKTALIVVSGAQEPAIEFNGMSTQKQSKFCSCEAAASKLGLDGNTICMERRFNILDLAVGAIANTTGNSDLAMYNGIAGAMKGVLRIHSPTLLITVSGMKHCVRSALRDAVDAVNSAENVNVNVTFVELPRSVVSYALWMPDVSDEALQSWGKMSISISIITQDRPKSLARLLKSLQSAFYVGDEVSLSINIDRKVDEETLKIANEFEWKQGPVEIRRRIIQGGLIRAVSESWYPSSDDNFGLLLEDDVELSPFFYLWLKYSLLIYHYDPKVSLPELSAIALYTPRIVEVLKERPRWNATEAFANINPHTPYLQQLPCSWGALFFPKHWREFFMYMGQRFTEDPKSNPVQIPHSRTNGWSASWKKFLIDMMYLRGYVTLYPNFGGNQTSLSTNHVELGAHIFNSSDRDARAKDFEVPLLETDFVGLLPDGRLPPMEKLPVVDLFNKPATLRDLKVAGAALRQDVLLCETNQTVVVDVSTGLPLRCAPFD